MAHNRRQTMIRPDVRFGSKADIAVVPQDVRFTPESGHSSAALKCLLCAKKLTFAPQQIATLFDQLVGARDHYWRHGNAQLFCRL